MSGNRHGRYLLLTALLLGGCQVGMPKQPVMPLAEPPPQPGMDIGFDIRSRWNDRGIGVVAGHRYRITVTRVADWRDKDIDATPADGWTERTVSSVLLGPMSFLRACPSTNWYTLVGVVRDGQGAEHCILIGNGLHDWTAPANGRLFVVANDYPSDSTYGNNRGVATVTIMHLPGDDTLP